MKKTVNKKLLDDIAKRYHLSKVVNDKDFDSRFHRLCLEWVLTFIRPGSSVLEMGYGEGNVTRGLLEASMYVKIVEGSELLAQSARELYGDAVTVYHSLFEEFSPTEQLDCILATNILEHVDDPSALLSLVKAWCSETTLIVVSVPNAESIHRRLAVLMGLQPHLNSLSERDRLVGHQRVYDYKMLKEQVTSMGFEIVAEKGFMLKILPNSMLTDFSPELLNALYSISDQLPIEQSGDMAMILKLK